MGGQIEVKSEYQRGSTFTFSIKVMPPNNNYSEEEKEQINLDTNNLDRDRVESVEVTQETQEDLSNLHEGLLEFTNTHYLKGFQYKA